MGFGEKVKKKEKRKRGEEEREKGKRKGARGKGKGGREGKSGMNEGKIPHQKQLIYTPVIFHFFLTSLSRKTARFGDKVCEIEHKFSQKNIFMWQLIQFNF